MPQLPTIPEANFTPSAVVSNFLPHRQTLLLCAIVFILFLRLQAIWPIGFYQDDAVMSLWKTEGQLSGKSVFGKSHEFFTNLMKYQGRFKPVVCYVVLPVHIAMEDNRVLYRCAQAVAQLIGLGAFAFLCLRLSRSHWYWGLGLLLFASFYEIRDYHDAAYSLFATCPLVVLLGSLSCYFALRCSERPEPMSNGYLWLAVLFSSAALCTMELALPFCGAATLFMLAGNSPWRSRLGRAFITGMPIVLFNGIDAYLRGKSIYSGTQMGSLSPAVLGHTYFGQVISAFPLSYFYYDPQHLFSSSWLWTADKLSAVAGGAAAAAAFYAGSAHLRRPSGWLLPVLGVLLLLLPSAMISVSLKYQRETSPGMGYLQTVFSYLGSSILTLLLVAAVADKLRPARGTFIGFRVVASLGLGMIMALTLLCSNRVAQSVNSLWRFPREMSEVWLRATRPAPGTQEIFIMDNDWLARWEIPAHLFLNRGSIGTYYTRREYAEKAPAIPPQASVVRFRFPDRTDPSDLALIIGSLPSADVPGQSRIVAFVVSHDQTKLQQSTLRLFAQDKSWEFPREILSGYRGYYYCRLDIISDSPDISRYGLVVP